MLDSYFWLAIRYSMNINPICDSSLKRSARRSFAPSQKSRRHNLSCVWTEALFIRYDFCGGAKAIQYRINIGLAYLWAYKIQKSCVCYILCSVSVWNNLGWFCDIVLTFLVVTCTLFIITGYTYLTSAHSSHIRSSGFRKRGNMFLWNVESRFVLVSNVEPNLQVHLCVCSWDWRY